MGLKSVGGKTEPWGMPFVKFLVLDVAPLYVTYPWWISVGGLCLLLQCSKL